MANAWHQDYFWKYRQEAMNKELATVFEGLYAEIEDAFIRKDLETIGRFLSPEFIANAPDGVRKSKADLLEGLRKQFETMDVLSWKRRVTGIEVDGDTARIVAEGVYKTRRDDAEPEELFLKNEDTWEEGDSGWRVRSSRPLK